MRNSVGLGRVEPKQRLRFSALHCYLARSQPVLLRRGSFYGRLAALFSKMSQWIDGFEAIFQAQQRLIEFTIQTR